MRILFISPSYYPHIGGVEYVVKSVAERLSKMGHEVTVLTGEPDTEKPVEEDVNGVSVIRWPTWSPGNAYHVPKLWGELERKLAELVNEVDVLHIHSVHGALPVWSGLKARSLGFTGKLVITPHYHGSGHTFLRRALWMHWRVYVKKLVKNVDIVHAVSRFEASIIRENFGVLPIVIEHGVEEDVLQFYWRPEDYVMYSGRIEKYKNIDRLARIVRALGSQRLKLELFGDGPYKHELKKKLDKLGVEYRLRGFQPRHEYLKAMSGARLFALISEREAFGQTVNEANAIGVPSMVARPWGENFKDRPRTLLIDLLEKDEEIAAKVSAFLEEAADQPRIIISSWSEIANRYLSMYMGLMRRELL